MEFCGVFANGFSATMTVVAAVAAVATATTEATQVEQNRTFHFVGEPVVWYGC